MEYISREIEEVSRALSIPAILLPPEETSRIREALRDRYEVDWRHDSVMIESATAHVYHPQAWSWLSEFIGDKEVIMLFNVGNDPDAWIIPSGHDLVRILAETFGFIFFMTSRSFDYVMAFDDNDCLIGAGRASGWVEGLPR